MVFRPGGGGIGGDQVAALPPAHGEAEPGEPVQALLVGVAGGGVQVPADILGDGGQQRLIAVGSAGIERDEPPVIGAQEGPDRADGLIRVQRTPDQAGRGPYDPNGGRRHNARPYTPRQYVSFR